MKKISNMKKEPRMREILDRGERPFQGKCSLKHIECYPVNEIEITIKQEY